MLRVALLARICSLALACAAAVACATDGSATDGSAAQDDATPPQPAAQANDAAPPLAEPARDPSADARLALHLDGLDTRVDRLAGIGSIVARAFEGALLRDADGPHRIEDGAAHAFLASLRREARDIYAADALRASLVEELAARDTKGALPLVVAWYETEIAETIREGRRDVSTPAGQRALASMLAQLPGRAPDETRLDKVRGLLEASRQAEVFLTLTFDTSSDVMEAIAPHLPSTMSGGADDWLTGQRAGRQSFSARVLRTLLFQDWYALRDLSDDDLATVINFWMSPAGRWYAGARIEAVQAVSRDRARQLGERLATPI
jgi:hypothetical protein